MKRRNFIYSAVALAVTPSIISAKTTRLTATPSQSLGPFYPDQFPTDVDNNLVVIGNNQQQKALGDILDLSGTVRDVNGKHVKNALVEIWQCDSLGRYIHSADATRSQRDEYFQGYGKSLTTVDGKYNFLCLKPVAYPGRAPHIHVAIRAKGYETLVTQLYIKGEATNNSDFLLNALRDRQQRDSLIVDLQESGEKDVDFQGEFNIVLRSA